MLYLTGANSSLNKSGGVAQTDPQKSLGGFVSISPVPNGELNSLFDLLSSYSLEKQREECVAIALINEYEESVEDLELKIITDPDSICRFEVAAVKLSDQLSMEQIPNRYALPINAEFYDATFIRAYCDIRIISSASPEEEVMFLPFQILVEFGSDCNNIDKTIEYIKNKFDQSGYNVRRLSKDVIRISINSDDLIHVDKTRVIAYSSETFKMEALTHYSSYGSSLILSDEELKNKEGIGLWLKRKFYKYKYKSNEELIDDYLKHKVVEEEEKFELKIEYEIVGRNHNSFDESFDESFN
jgi:hypothetical protein